MLQKRSCRRHAVPRVTEQVSLTFGEFTVARLDLKVQGYCGEKSVLREYTNRCASGEKAAELLGRDAGVIFIPVARDKWSLTRWVTLLRLSTFTIIISLTSLETQTLPRGWTGVMTQARVIRDHYFWSPDFAISFNNAVVHLTFLYSWPSLLIRLISLRSFVIPSFGIFSFSQDVKVPFL